jgi:hypothetical protein
MSILRADIACRYRQAFADQQSSPTLTFIATLQPARSKPSRAFYSGIHLRLSSVSEISLYRFRILAKPRLAMYFAVSKGNSVPGKIQSGVKIHVEP